MSAIHSENKPRLYLGKRNRAGRKRPNARRRSSASAQRIECVAALEDEQGEQRRTEPQEGTDSFHVGSYHRLASIAMVVWPSLSKRVETFPVSTQLESLLEDCGFAHRPDSASWRRLEFTVF